MPDHAFMPRPDDASEYALIDLGDGRQLGQFGPLIVDRPYPAAVEPAADPAAWARADLRYERPDFGGDGSWVAAASAPPTRGRCGMRI